MSDVRTKAETLLFLIPLLIEDSEHRRKLLGEIERDETNLAAIDNAMRAGRQAIMKLPSDCARDLTVAMCSVFIMRSEEQTRKILRTSFRESGRYERGVDFRWISIADEEVKARKANQASGNFKGDKSRKGGNRDGYWVHWRKPITAWWIEYRKNDPRGKKKRSEVAKKDTKAAFVEELLADLEALGLRDLAEAKRKKWAMLTDAKGFVLDCLVVPYMDVSDIAQHLARGTAAITVISLHDAITQYDWTSSEVRQPWHALWLSLVDREREALDAMVEQADNRRSSMRNRMLSEGAAPAAGSGRRTYS